MTVRVGETSIVLHNVWVWDIVGTVLLAVWVEGECGHSPTDEAGGRKLKVFSYFMCVEEILCNVLLTLWVPGKCCNCCPTKYLHKFTSNPTCNWTSHSLNRIQISLNKIKTKMSSKSKVTIRKI